MDTGWSHLGRMNLSEENASTRMACEQACGMVLIDDWYGRAHLTGDDAATPSQAALGAARQTEKLWAKSR